MHKVLIALIILFASCHSEGPQSLKTIGNSHYDQEAIAVSESPTVLTSSITIPDPSIQSSEHEINRIIMNDVKQNFILII